MEDDLEVIPDDPEDVCSDEEVVPDMVKVESREDFRIPDGAKCVQGNVHLTLGRLVSQQTPSVQAKLLPSRSVASLCRKRPMVSKATSSLML